MKPIDVEELLWKISDAQLSESGDDGGPTVGDEELRAFKEGSLPPEEATSVVERLGSSLEARQRLAVLGGVHPPVVAEAVRRRVLARAAWHRRPYWRAAAAVLLAVLVGALGLEMAMRREPPKETTLAGLYEVSVEAMAVRRDVPSADRVLPDTRVVIRVEPKETALAGIEFGLYKVSPTGLERLAVEPPIEMVLGRGAVRFTAPARLLVGAEPGRRSVYVVAAPEGDLPERIAVGSEGPIEALAQSGRRFVHQHRLDMQQ